MKKQNEENSPERYNIQRVSSIIITLSLIHSLIPSKHTTVHSFQPQTDTFFRVDKHHRELFQSNPIFPDGGICSSLSKCVYTSNVGRFRRSFLKATPFTPDYVTKDEEEENENKRNDENSANKQTQSASTQKLNILDVEADSSFYTINSDTIYDLGDSEETDFYDEEDEDDYEYDYLDEDDNDDNSDDDSNEVDPNYEAQISSQYDDGVDTYTRDLDLIEMEREDRLFQNERTTDDCDYCNSCILVAVEDLSKKRNAQRKSSQLNNQNFHENEPIYFTLEESMTEMRELIKTAGLNLKAVFKQRLNEPVPRTYVGTGKLQAVKKCLNSNGINTVVFDAELSPRQQKILENTFNKELIQNDFLGSSNAEVKVLDRTALILDIFAQHARTREGKLQVDLALHQYRKPRLTKMWTHLERQSGSGGVGLRGPGESQLEIDKRLIRDRILVLQRKIDNVQKQRDLHRRGRDRAGLPKLAVVGYTNAGKSTLLNFLTRAGILAEDILFATLDPTTRKVKLPGYKTHPEVLLTDTVGFIQALPTQLIAAFRATLEEVLEADVLIHVIDVTNPSWKKQENSVLKTLSEIDAGHKPMVRVFNKIDLLDENEADEWKFEAAGMEQMSVAVSAMTGDGLQDFVAVVEDALRTLLVAIEVEIPFSKGEELNLIHEVGTVDTVDYRATGTYVACKVPKSLANRLKPYYVSNLAHKNSSNRGETDEEEIDWVALGRGRHKKKNAQ